MFLNKQADKIPLTLINKDI